MAKLDLDHVLKTRYESPAGRKNVRKKYNQPKTLSTSETANRLGVKTREVRVIVKEGWISPHQTEERYWKFCPNSVAKLVEELRTHYVPLTTAAKTVNQSELEFQRTWMDTRFIAGKRFANKLIISNQELDGIQELWNEAATSSIIGRSIGRERWLCSNLQKMGQINSHTTLGTGNHKVHLFSRNDTNIARFQIKHL